jgi:hypothetical protein
MVKSRFVTSRAAARHMIKQHSGVIIFVTGALRSKLSTDHD